MKKKSDTRKGLLVEWLAAVVGSFSSVKGGVHKEVSQLETRGLEKDFPERLPQSGEYGPFTWY